jgi:EPTP domain
VQVLLNEVQRIPTSGARAVEPFSVGGLDLLAIPQLATDVPGAPAGMNGGDSDTRLLLLRRSGDRFAPWATLPAPGGEDAEFFTIGPRPFLAVASIRVGAGPYDLATDSVIYAWRDGTFMPFQRVPGYAAKQWRHWQADGRHFLGLAQGVAEPGAGPSAEQHNRASMVYEWDGERFAPFQEIPSRWAYNWHPLRIDGTLYVAHADHLDPSVLYRWDGGRFRPHQPLAERGGRAFASFEDHLLVACLQEPTRLMRWTGAGFDVVQELDGLGARELAVFEYESRVFVVRVNFVLGTREAPVPALASQVYEWRGGRLEVAAEFPTCGGTDAALVSDGGRRRLIVSNSLSPDLRFRADTVVYSLEIG